MKTTVNAFAKAMKIETAGMANHVLQFLEQIGVAKQIGTVLMDNGLRGKRPYVYEMPEKVTFDVKGEIKNEIKMKGEKPAKKAGAKAGKKAGAKVTKAGKGKKVTKAGKGKKNTAPTAENTTVAEPVAPKTEDTVVVSDAVTA